MKVLCLRNVGARFLGMAHSSAGLTSEEKAKYEKIKWQYGTAWIAENMSKGELDGSQQQS